MPPEAVFNVMLCYGGIVLILVLIFGNFCSKKEQQVAKLLAMLQEVVNKHGPDSEEARCFILEHDKNKEFVDLALTLVLMVREARKKMTKSGWVFDEERPWGSFEVLKDEEDYKVKVLTINKKSSLSKQYHEKRDEQWTVVAGAGIVEIDGAEMLCNVGDTFFVPKGAIHRIRNGGLARDLVIIEVQTGESFDEEDIVRLEDKYGRADSNS